MTCTTLTAKDSKAETIARSLLFSVSNYQHHKMVCDGKNRAMLYIFVTLISSAVMKLIAVEHQ